MPYFSPWKVCPSEIKAPAIIIKSLLHGMLIVTIEDSLLPCFISLEYTIEGIWVFVFLFASLKYLGILNLHCLDWGIFSIPANWEAVKKV